MLSAPLPKGSERQRMETNFLCNGSQPPKPTTLEDAKQHTRGGKQRLMKEIQFMSGRFYTMAVFDEKRRTVAYCKIYNVVGIVEHHIKNFVFSPKLQ